MRSNNTAPDRVHVTDTYDVPDTDDADADTDDDAGPCEDIVVLAKTHNGASEDTYCGSDDDDIYSGYPVRSGKGKGKGKGIKNIQSSLVR